MRFATQRPDRPLADFVDHFWFYEGLDLPYPRERVVPDGTSELMINLCDEPRRLFDHEGGGRHRDFHRAWLSGTHTGFIEIDVRPGSSLLGVHFKPGGAAAVLGFPADRLRDQVIELEELWGPSVSGLRDTLIEAPEPADKFRRLGQFLLKRAKRRAPRSPAVTHALDRFITAPHLVSIDAVARELGVSHKHLIALFHAEVGLTPKRFCRLRRFQRVLATVGRGGPVDWADLACACGYYDQAHFIQEFRHFAGMNPSAWLSHRGEYARFIPLEAGAAGPDAAGAAAR